MNLPCSSLVTVRASSRMINRKAGQQANPNRRVTPFVPSKARATAIGTFSYLSSEEAQQNIISYGNLLSSVSSPKKKKKVSQLVLVRKEKKLNSQGGWKSYCLEGEITLLLRKLAKELTSNKKALSQDCTIAGRHQFPRDG
ncbi:pentatricopeptide repeat (PPR) superfamily protein [Striga asiatica]|uniref:Pentatricopeptide repeat (PPR) superfamily protein n=1 Tax=Striga asiatica TaxID=4170 RepID=A0A5A7QMD8_STRAF|nr:pentatricopeptide repeat (PPR) superfamily protein [Striga asiatica]